MVAGNAIDSIRAPGRLIVNPTGPFVDGTDPYGGTEIGRAREVAILPIGGGYRVECEGLGEASDVLEGSNRVVVAFFLRGWDDDGIETLMAGGYAAGANTAHARWNMPGTRSPGQSAIGRAVSLLFAPDNPDVAPGFIVYRGIPTIQDSSELTFMRSEELGLPIAVECLRDASDRIIEVGRLDDLPTP